MKPANLDRRALLLGGVALSVLAACNKEASSEAAVDAADPTLVSTSFGQLRGTSVDGVIEFRGVRYAQPPVGALRFQAPKNQRPGRAKPPRRIMARPLSRCAPALAPPPILRSCRPR